MPSRRSFVTGAATFAGTTLLRVSGEAAETQTAAPPGEPTLERIQRSKTLQLLVGTGEAPFFIKDAAANAYSGAAIDMAKDIAATCDAKLELTESSPGAYAADLQSGKADLAIGVVPLPKAALQLTFTPALMTNPYCLIGRRGFHAGTWAELDKPEIKLALDNSSPDGTAKRFAPNATMIGFRGRDEALNAVQSGRADGIVTGALAALAALKRNAQLGEIQTLRQPRVEVPIVMAIRGETDRRWHDFLESWIAFNRDNRQIRDWLVAGLGLRADELPADLDL
jgi:polar amino acid transport system substrate-binding protein